MDLRAFLQEKGVRFEWLRHEMAYTAQELAHREHVSGSKVIKPVVVEADGRFILCALPASRRVDLDQLRRAINASAARVADESDLAKIFSGCELGAEPPIGSLFGLQTIMDESLREAKEVTFQAGTHQDAVRISLADYLALAQPAIARFAR